MANVDTTCLVLCDSGVASQGWPGEGKAGSMALRGLRHQDWLPASHRRQSQQKVTQVNVSMCAPWLRDQQKSNVQRGVDAVKTTVGTNDASWSVTALHTTKHAFGIN